MRRRQLLQLVAVSLAPTSRPHVTTTKQITLTLNPAPNISAIVQQARQAWLDGNSRAFVQLFADDGVLIVPGARWQGHRAIAMAFEEYAAEHRVTAITIRNLVVQPPAAEEAIGHAVVEWVWEDINTVTQLTSRADDAIAIDVCGGQVLRWREYIDNQPL